MKGINETERLEDADLIEQIKKTETGTENLIDIAKYKVKDNLLIEKMKDILDKLFYTEMDGFKDALRLANNFVEIIGGLKDKYEAQENYKMVYDLSILAREAYLKASKKSINVNTEEKDMIAGFSSYWNLVSQRANFRVQLNKFREAA